MDIKKRLTIPRSAPRPLLFFIAVVVLLISSAFSGLGFEGHNAFFLIMGTVFLALWFVILFAAALPQTDGILTGKTDILNRCVRIIFLGLIVVGLAEAAGYFILAPLLLKNHIISANFHQILTTVRSDYEYNDATALSQQAVDNLLKGQNPYAHSNIVTALQQFEGTYSRVTPVQTGQFADAFPAPDNSQLEMVWDQAVQTPERVPPELESNVCYPAGSFLLPALFIRLGITDIRIVYVIFILAGLVYAAWVIPKQKRLLFICLALVSLELWNSVGVGELGSLCFPFLIVAWLSLKKNMWLSSICMGIAAATKQTMWFFLPFYVILLWRTWGTKKSAAGIAIVAGVFLAANLPFIFADHKLWLDSITSPMTDPLFPLGSGLITLVTSGVLDIHATLPFAILEGIVFITAIVWYFRYGARYPQTGPVLAILPLFFAWRSLFSYFFYVSILVLAYILIYDDTVSPDARMVKVKSS